MPIVIVILGSLVQPKYQAHTTILVQETALMNPFLEDLSISFNLEERIDALRLMARSHVLLSQVIREQNLAKENELDKINGLVDRLARDLQIDLIGSDVIKMTLTWQKPEQMAGLINAISRQFLTRLKAPGQTSVVNSEEFLARQLLTTQGELEEAESALADFKIKYADNLPLLQSSHMMSGTQLEGRLRETEIKLLKANTKRSTLYKRLEHINPVIGILEEEIIKYRAELAVLRASYTDKHSTVRSILQRLTRLENESSRLIKEQRKLTPEQIEQLWQRAANLPSKGIDNEQTGNNPSISILLSQLEQLQSAETQIETLNDEIKLLKKQILHFSTQRENFAALEKELKILERNTTVKSIIYNKLLERYEMANITSKLGTFEESDKLKVIELPNVPENASNRSWIINLLIGLGAGIGLGTSLTTISILLDTKIYHPLQLTKITNTPLLTILPYINEDTDPP
jgi:uncharacterized protein involved in exopolysaccharide biosynthesis